ncbi:glycosyltransferase [Arcticibacterium luteifluviistationis]|uniref:Glycosyl transferase n=1 Tax=Arcticibacterium luteifluviistationis TaxID=1784714 RepID=A0A2Z4GFD5_9BACT|nr:glycosyltransferase [Arcticibacterium luteifluviistationis]AWW00017.1 glycosyl transferase [Arcticibacterium luteifluviistationis]
MISIIIPTYNEAEQIKPCLEQISTNIPEGTSFEIILADSPSSTDNLEKLTKQLGFKYLVSNKPGRNHQMNAAARIAKGTILYFVHADVLVHKDFIKDINQAIREGADLGAYRSQYDHYPNPLLYVNAFFTRFPMIWCRGGDQTLFIKKEVFSLLGGFSEKHCIMEDYDILERSKGKYNFKIIPKNVLISSRKYVLNGYWTIQKANYLVMKKWMKKDAGPEELNATYKRLLKF